MAVEIMPLSVTGEEVKELTLCELLSSIGYIAYTGAGQEMIVSDETATQETVRKLETFKLPQMRKCDFDGSDCTLDSCSRKCILL